MTVFVLQIIRMVHLFLHTVIIVTVLLYITGGGAVSVAESSSSIDVDSISFYNCRARSSGGDVHSRYSKPCVV